MSEEKWYKRDDAEYWKKEYLELSKQLEEKEIVLDKIKKYCMNDRNFVVPDEYTQNITDGIQDDILELLEEIE